MTQTVTTASPSLLSMEIAAQELSTTRRNLYTWIKSGKLVTVKVGGRRFVRRVDLESFVAKLEVDDGFICDQSGQPCSPEA